jgi:hypothetical protein
MISQVYKVIGFFFIVLLSKEVRAAILYDNATASLGYFAPVLYAGEINSTVWASGY